MHKVAVLGLGRFGVSVAERLYNAGVEVLAIDRNLKLVEAVQQQVSVAVACDATKRENLQAYDLGRMDAAVVAIGTNFESSVLVTLLCKEFGVPLVVAKALNELQAQVLREVGADRIVMPEEEMGMRLAEHLLHDSVVDFVELPDGYSLRRLPIPAEWAGRSLAELRLLNDQRLNLVQIVRVAADTATAQAGEKPSRERIPLPSGEALLEQGDEVDVIGRDGDLNRLAELGRTD